MKTASPTELKFPIQIGKKLQPMSSNWWRKWGSTSKNQKKSWRSQEAKQQELLEKINCTSKNSSSPPSIDPPHAEKRPEKKKSGKKRGGQPGHKGHSRFLYDLSACESVLDHHPKTCSCCGEILLGEDANPYRHQIVEIPPINPIIVEHRLHKLVCQQCGTSTRATLPVDVHPSGYGVRVVALVTVPLRIVPPQSKNGTECNARYIWNFHVLGYSQQPET